MGTQWYAKPSPVQDRIKQKAYMAKCLGPTKKKGPTKAKKGGKRGLKGQNEGKRPLKRFAPQKKSKSVPRAYESLNRALLLFITGRCFEDN